MARLFWFTVEFGLIREGGAVRIYGSGLISSHADAANDYRTVDLPGLAEDETGDAWLGLFKSYDGGQRWTTTLLPGYPQDHSAVGLASPIKGYGAGADAVVRAGTNGLMYYAGLVFDRSDPATPEVPGKSAIFVARYIDNNNKEAGDTFEYLGAQAWGP